jgi:hypothetical protein
MDELIVNLHMHTKYSDGHVTHSEIAQAALRAGLDAVIITDHNVLVEGPEDYYRDGDRRVLLLVGEEIHDQARQPQKSHLLVLGTGRELAPLAADVQKLVNTVRQDGGLTFIAHPTDPAAPAVGETDISWVDWQVQGITGMEVWNAMSEFKSLLKSKLHAIYYAFNPGKIAHSPFQETLSKWDELTAAGQKVVAIGGSDAHAFPARLGPLRRTLFPYEFHFQTINTHLLPERPLSGELQNDRRLVLDTLARGRAFIGYDLPAPTRGFRFSARGFDRMVIMGEELPIQNGVTLQIRLPRPVECRLIKDGQIVQTWDRYESCAFITKQPGAYRVEAYIDYQGRQRGWIFSNPIYLR